MLFSIIVPVYDVGTYIADCLQSIENQSFRNYELIVVMDKTSHDESETIVREYEKKYNNIKVVEQGHHGLGAARNFGMKFAIAEYLVFLDSDDKFGDQNYLSDIAKAIEEKKTDFVITRSIKFVGDEGGEVGQPWDADITDNLNRRDALIKIINSGYFGISAWGKAVRRQFCLDNNLKFVDGYSEDYDWTSRIINLTDLYAFVNTPGVVHYIRPGSLSGNHNYKQVNDLGIRIESWINRIGRETDFEKAQLGYLAYSYYIYIALIHYVEKVNQKELWKREKNLRFLRKYGISRKCKLSLLVCRVFGTKIGSYILHEYVQKKKTSDE